MLASILYGLSHVCDLVLNMVLLLVILSVGISWFSGDPRNQYVQLVYSLTEPMYRPFRKFTRRLSNSIDLAPTIVLLIVVFLQKSMGFYLRLLSEQLR